MQKNLGQHFLTSEGAVAAAVKALGLTGVETVVEIGPGTGVITCPLLEQAGNVIAIEKDPVLAKNLEETLINKKLQMVTGDIRDFKPEHFDLTDYLVLGNIPYYITGKILRIVLSATPPPKRAVFITQKEVAERIVARDGKESILSISVKAFGTPTYLKTIKRGSFSPPPRVDSALILIDNISRNFFNNITEPTFFDIVKKGFAHKRKQLGSNLNISREIFAACAVTPETRAENLTLADWKCLALKSRYK